jgi:hypothetical protein
MSRTPDQVKADQAVEDALAARAIAYGAEPGGVVTAWFAVTTAADYDSDGDPVTKYALATPHDQPVHTDLGLLAYATARVRSWCVDPDD